MYLVRYGAEDWLCVAERLEEWRHGGGWPADRADERTTVITWAKAVDSAAISFKQPFTLPMPGEWVHWLLTELLDVRDDDFPWQLLPQLIGQVRSQNRRR